MRILGHIHTFNDEDVIDRSLAALLAQTHPVDEVLLVDNGSTDSTLRRPLPPNVTVIRHRQNLGTSGAVITGLQYATSNSYDWIWVLDADAAPHEDALEKLLSLYQTFPAHIQEQTWLLASLPVDAGSHRPIHGVIFSPRGQHSVSPRPGDEYYEFDATVWTGCLFKLKAVRQIGLPSADYVLDWGEYEYGYCGKLAGLRAFMHTRSIVDHNIGGCPSMGLVTYRLGPLSYRLFELPPIRCYYLVRNMIYFWLFEFEPRRFTTFLPKFLKALHITANFLVRPSTHRAELVACLRGIRDGFSKRLHHRY